MNMRELANLVSDERGELRINWGVMAIISVAFVGVGIALMAGAFGGSEGRSTTFPLGIFFVVLPFAIVLPALLIIKAQKGRRVRLETGGIPATARLLSIRTTGSEFGVGNYGTKLVLEVTPPDGQPYKLKERMFLNVAEIGSFVPGAVFPVLLDPKNKKKFIFGTSRQPSATINAPTSWGAPPGGGDKAEPPVPFPGNVGAPTTVPQVPAVGVQAQKQPQFYQGQQAVQLLQSLGLGNLAAGANSISVNVSSDASIADLQRARESGGLAPDSQVQYSISAGGDEQAKIQQIIDQCDYAVLASGETAESTILEVSDLGVRVAGNNPAVKMLVEVHPVDRQPFKAEVAGFVNEASMHKLQVGRKLMVKYDPDDTTRVAIFHTGPDESTAPPRVVE